MFYQVFKILSIILPPNAGATQVSATMNSGIKVSFILLDSKSMVKNLKQKILLNALPGVRRFEKRNISKLLTLERLKYLPLLYDDFCYFQNNYALTVRRFYITSTIIKSKQQLKQGNKNRCITAHMNHVILSSAYDIRSLNKKFSL